MSLVKDKENCGRDSSNKLGRRTQGLFDLGLEEKYVSSAIHDQSKDAFLDSKTV